MESIFGQTALDICGSLETSCSSNQENAIEREDIAASCQIISCNPEETILEKTALLQKNVLIREKIKIPSEIVIPELNNISIEFVEGYPIKTEVISEEMEVASQKSCVSVMEICSQESRMEVSSQESYSSRMDALSQENRLANEEVNLETVIKTEPVDCYSDNPNADGVAGHVDLQRNLKRKHEDICLSQKTPQARETLLMLREIAVASREKAASAHEQLVRSLENNLVRSVKKFSSKSFKRLKKISN